MSAATRILRAGRGSGRIFLGSVLGGAFYLLLIDTLSAAELYAGIGATLVAAAAFELSALQGTSEATVGPRMLLVAWRAALRVPYEIAVVSREAVVQLARPAARRGAFRAVSFRDANDGPRTIGRRALAEALGSLAPNTIVLGVDPDAGLLLVHQLRPRGNSDELDATGLR